jgi:hypothetical protein
MLKPPPGEALARVESEIRKERAEALGRAGERLALALRSLCLMRDEVYALESGRARPADGADPAEAAVRRRIEYSALRQAAQRYRYYLVVQREAVGFRKHGDVDRLYPIPDPLRAGRATRGESP